MENDTAKKRYPKYDKHGKIRPFQDRPFVDELNEKEYKDEVLLTLWRMESEQLKNYKNNKQINIILKVFLGLTILAIIVSIFDFL